MKILFLTNNDITLSLLEWLKTVEGSENVTPYSDRISASQFSIGNQFHGIEFIISYNYRHIVKQDVISLFPHRIINLHISMLPWNKGANPNIWSFIEGTPTGVTIHEINAGIDTGDILIQREIVFDNMAETLKSSYEKSHAIMSKLFRDNWHMIRNGSIKPKPQVGTMHYVKDSCTFDHIINYDDTIQDFVSKYSELTLEG